MSDDPYSLERFVEAQNGSYETACRELHDGRKRTHWIWYVFPQMKGLGSSETSEYYGIGSLDEARAYLAHPVLGKRLAEVTMIMTGNSDRSLRDVLGSPDDMKFRSSMTLFSAAADPASIYSEALRILCAGEADERTLALLKTQ